MKRVSQIKPKSDQGGACIKQKTKLPISPLLSKPIIQLTEKKTSQQPQNLVQQK